MPPAANPNPNPDRFRRAGSVAPAAEAKDELVPEPLLPVRAPASAPRARGNLSESWQSCD